MTIARELLNRLERLAPPDGDDYYPPHLNTTATYKSSDFGKIVRQLPTKLPAPAIRELKKLFDSWDRKDVIHSMEYDKPSRTWIIYINEPNVGRKAKDELEGLLNDLNINYRDVLWDAGASEIRVIFPIK